MGLFDWVDDLTDAIVKPLASIVGLGAKSNAIPSDSPRYNDAPRKVILGWHPVGGIAGQMFQQLVLPLNALNAATQFANAPNPTHHWGVLVGDYVHELNADAKLNVVYQNYRFDISELWYQKQVGTTRYNDEAIRLAGEAAIQKMAGSYNIQDNNCQKLALGILDIILDGGRSEKFMTSYSTSAQMASPKYKLRPAVHVFATEATKDAMTEAASAKEKEAAKAAGEYQVAGTIMCQIFDTEEEAEAARKVYEAEKAVADEKGAKELAELAAKAAQTQAEMASAAEVTVTAHVEDDEEHKRTVDDAKQLMEEKTPRIQAGDLAA